MKSVLYYELARDRLIVAHEEVPLRLPDAPPALAVLQPQQVPFISYPYEWCFSELKAAALLTLDLQRRALARGMALRDASAYWTYDAHRRKVEQAFQHLEYAARIAGPKLIFADFISPHPPFVFAPDGRPRANAPRVLGLMDGSHFHGSRAEYVAGYRDQAQFVANRVLPIIDTILSRPGPRPVIILHGDHGPGSMSNWDDMASANTRERLGIFSAYRFPKADPPLLYRNLSPVNGLRIMANRRLRTSLPILPERSFASSWRHPFQWVPVRADGRHELSSVRH